MTKTIEGPGDGVGDFGHPGYWCEPFCVETVELQDCEERGCENDARWSVEVIGWSSRTLPVPAEAGPTAYVCDQHLPTVMDRWT